MGVTPVTKKKSLPAFQPSEEVVEGVFVPFVVVLARPIALLVDVLLIVREPARTKTAPPNPAPPPDPELGGPEPAPPPTPPFPEGPTGVMD